MVVSCPAHDAGPVRPFFQAPPLFLGGLVVTLSSGALDNRPLRWIGERSYSLFLVHSLVIAALTPHVVFGGDKTTARRGGPGVARGLPPRRCAPASMRGQSSSATEVENDASQALPDPRPSSSAPPVGAMAGVGASDGR